MKDGYFIFDNVVHMYDNRPANVINDLAKRNIEGFHKAFGAKGHSLYRVDEKLTLEVDEARRYLFEHSDTDMAMAQTVPQVETELARLQRDYEIVKVNYDQLRQRQESARLARDLETKANKVQFRIVDPPQVPLTPSAPNRPLLLSAVLVAGVLSGAAVAFLLSQINATYFNLASLRRGLAWPVLGAVSAISSASERRRRLRDALSFGIVGLGLFAAYGGLLTVEIMGII